MDAEDFAGQTWLYAIWSDAVLSLIAATAPMFGAISSSASSMLLGVSFAWLSLLLLRAADVGLIKGLIGGGVIFAVILVGLRPVEFAHPGRAGVQMTQIQAAAATIVFNVQGTFAAALTDVLDAQSVAGTIIPAEAATRDAVERNASTFSGTDLARLIRDYNIQCAPGASALAGPEHAATRDAYHAIGLLGGGGLGIPQESISVLAQIKESYSALWAFSKPVWEWGGMEHLNRSQDISAVRSRRSEGIAALEAAGKGFSSTRAYALPTQSNWLSTYSGKENGRPDYLRAGDAPGALADQLTSNVVAWDGKGKSDAIGLIPGDCAEAYRLAQWGAEQAYKALEATGKQATGGQRSSAESGAVGAAMAWQRTLKRTINGGEVDSDSPWVEGASGTLAAFQMFKNAWSWLDLNTLLPAYIAGMAGLTWLILIIAPIALLVAPLRGVQVILSWFSLMIFPLLCLIFAHLLSVGAALMMAGVSAQQAAAAAGWQGGAADLDLVRGALGMVAAILLAATTWLAGSISGVSLGGLAGSGAGAVASATWSANAVGSAIRMVSSAMRMLDPGKARPTPKTSSGDGGGGQDGGGSSGGGSSGGRSAAPQSDVVSAIRNMNKATQDGMARSSKQSNYQGMMRRKHEAAQTAPSSTGDSLVPPKNSN